MRDGSMRRRGRGCDAPPPPAIPPRVFQLAGASSRNALLGEAGAHNIFGIFNVKYGLPIEPHVAVVHPG